MRYIYPWQILHFNSDQEPLCRVVVSSTSNPVSIYQIWEIVKNMQLRMIVIPYYSMPKN